MKVATAFSIVSSLLVISSVSALLHHCDKTTGDVFDGSYDIFKAGLQCSHLDKACLDAILNNTEVVDSTDYTKLGFGFYAIYTTCTGDSADSTFPPGMDDTTMKNYFTKHCDTAANRADLSKMKSCMGNIIRSFQGMSNANCYALGSLKKIFDASVLDLLHTECIHKMSRPFAGLTTADIATYLVYLPEGVWNGIDSLKSEPLKTLFGAAAPSLLHTPLVNNKKFLKMVSSLKNLHENVIKVITDGTQVLEMRDPFQGLDSERLKSLHVDVWTKIAALDPTTNAAEITKVGNMDPAAVKTALATPTFANSFISVLGVLPSSLLKQLDEGAVTYLINSLSAPLYEKFNGAAVAKATVAINATATADLTNLLTDNDVTGQKKLFVENFCGVFQDFTELRTKFTFLVHPVVPSKVCFLKLTRPLKEIDGANLSDIVNANGTVKVDTRYLPTGFTKDAMTKTVFASLKSVGLYKYASGTSPDMDIFCSWGYKFYINIKPNKIDTLEIGNECLSKMKALFNKDKKIVDNIADGVDPATIDAATQMTDPSIKYFAGIAASDLLILPEAVIRKIKGPECIDITQNILSDALKISTTSNLITHLDYASVPPAFYQAFTNDVLIAIKSKLAKEQWAMTNPDNLKDNTGTNWINEANLKVALEDNANVAFLKTYCSKRGSVKDIRNTFTGFIVNAACLENLISPLSGFTTVSEFAGLHTDTFKMKDNIFDSDVTLDKITKKVFGSIEATILNSSTPDPLLLKICEMGEPSWLDLSFQINGKFIRTDCRDKINSNKPFKSDKSIKDNLAANVRHAKIDASKMTDNKVKYFEGIAAVDLVKLPELVIKKIIHPADFTSISQKTFIEALKISPDNNLVVHLDFTKVPKEFYAALNYEILDIIKDKLGKGQWKLTTPENLKDKTGSSWINETNLKEALAEKGNEEFLRKYCKLRTSTKDIRTTFPDLKMTVDCIEYLTNPLTGLTIDEIAELNGQVLKMKEDTFEMTPDKLTQKMFGSIDASILNGEDPAFIALCENAFVDWLDRGKINTKPVHANCQGKMKKLVEELKREMKNVGKNVKLDKFNQASDKTKEEFISDPKECENFDNLAQLQAVIKKVTDLCYQKLSGSDKLSGLKTFVDVQKDVFKKIKPEDIKETDADLWSTVSITQLKEFSSYNSELSAEEYKKHPCSKLTAHKFIAKIKTESKKEEIRKTCYDLTKVQNGSSVTFRAALGLIVFTSILSLLIID